MVLFCIYILVTFYIALLLGTLKNVDLYYLTNFLMFADVCLLFLDNFYKFVQVSPIQVRKCKKVIIISFVVLFYVQ